MKKLTSMFFLFLTLVFLITTAYAQGVPDKSQNKLSTSVGTQPFDPSFPKPEPQVIKEGLLAPSEFDIAENQYLLNQPNTGLIRLMPRELHDWEVYKVEKKIEMRGGGAFFSFHYRVHPYGSGSDIMLERGHISVGFAGADYGMMTDLGVTTLEQIAFDDTRAAYLLNYESPTKEPDARKEAVKFYPGFSAAGAIYRNGLPAVSNHTYLLRSISHNRSDVLVAFRVARIDDDGSVIIAWKLLKEFPVPTLINPNVATKTTTPNH